jgi:hypothetical protein
VGEPLEQDRVACNRCGGQCGTYLDPGVPGGGLRARGGAPSDLGQVGRVVRAEALLAAGQGEQAVDELLVTLVEASSWPPS